MKLINNIFRASQKRCSFLLEQIMCDICKTIEKSICGDNPYFVKELKTGIVVLGWNQHFYGYTLRRKA